MIRVLLALMIGLALGSPAALAHEMRPGFLSIKEKGSDEYSVLWKVPALGDKRLGIYLRLPENCTARGEPLRSIEDAAYLERSMVICVGGLKHKEIFIDGLNATLTDVLGRIEYRDGTTEIARLTPESPAFNVSGAQSGWQVAGTYFRLGVEHILTGLDHLLFVFALILLIHDRWMLVKTVTAFTIAHTITLGGATLGYFSLPQKPVEAAIALSIAFVASELLKMKEGERRLSEAYPWIVAFSFGLLHGFGFAGALKEVGLPQSDVPLALLIFNLGVEAGQLMFVAVVLIALQALQIIVTAPKTAARVIAAYSIGAVSMFWLIARVASFGQ